jgi:quercetin dioxygenase-like cupin family protein
MEARITPEAAPGEVLLVPAGTIHWVENVGNNNWAELATCVVEKGKPLIARVK